jgi:hypothetical protein
VNGKLRFAVVAALAAGLLVMAGGPAVAYPTSLTRPDAYVDTDNCYYDRDTSGLEVERSGEYCVIDDDADGTFFHIDPGGWATKVEYRLGGQLVAKVEFHPYGESLWIYDTRNDGDTIYVTVQTGGHGNWGKAAGPYEPPGSDAVIEYKRINYDLSEGQTLRIRVYDDVKLTDFLGEFYPVT